MASDGQIVFEVTADGSHAISDIKSITSTIQQEAGKWDTAAKQSADNIGNSFSGMLKKLAAGFSAVKIGKALLDLGKDALEAASDLAEVQNVVDVTFGDNANQIEKWAKNAGTQFGLTETQAKKFTSTMGAMLKSSGMSGQQIVDVSTDLAGLAADMASFYNLDFEEAFSKIRSGISGQTMPLKELGIDMSVATLNAFALQQGLEKTFDQMSQSEQTMLRYQYLMSATADAQGDFSRTSTEYANSMRTLETNITRVKTALGTTFYSAVTEATNWLNTFLELLLPDESKRTVLDDFNDIDIDTEGKLENIRKIAEEAKLLTDELDAIGGSKTDKAGSKLQQFASDIENIKLDQGKAGIVKDFVASLSENITTLSDLTGQDAEGAKQWLEEIGAAADSLDPEDAAGWEKLINSIKEGLPGLENTDFGSAFFAALGGGFSDVSSQTSVLEWAIDSLGDKTNKTAEEQALWLETCKRLVQTIPGLSSLINTETGEIKGGTQAVKDYIKAWEEGQTKLVLLGALEEKESALSSRFSDLPGLQLDLALEKRRAKQRLDELKQIYQQYGVNIGFDQNGKISRDFSSVFGLDEEGKKALNAAADAFDKQMAKANAAEEAYNNQKEALEEARQALIEYKQTIDEMPGSVDNATGAVDEWSEEAKDNAKTLIEAAQTSLTALADHAQGVRDSVEKTVDGIVKGFSKISKAGDESRQKSAEYAEEETQALNKYSSVLGNWTKNGAVDLQAMSDNYDNLSKEEQAAYNELAKIHNKQKEVNDSLAEFSPEGMKANLQGQIEYMQEYIDNLEKARQMGLSNELLASLSDGSAESAEYLAALVGNGDEAATQAALEVDKVYQEVQKKKKEFTNELTGQQLTVDQVYQSMAAEAKAAVEALDLEGDAKTNAGKTISGLASGIAEHVPEVQTAVDDIETQLNRLSGWGINIDFGSFGSIGITVTNPVNGEHESGLNFVPFDGYLASLHEGEGILTAEENRIWQRFKDGGNTFDYDTMGGVMRDNIKAGGNVYLDGKTVGSVISTQQGKAYRQLTRSGWQA